MNTQRKLHTFFLIILGFNCMHMNAMQQPGDQNKIFYFAVGCAIGLGHARMYDWYTNHEDRLLLLEEKMEKCEKKTKNQHYSSKDIKHDQKAKEKHLDQTPTSIKDEQEKRQRTTMKQLNLLS